MVKISKLWLCVLWVSICLVSCNITRNVPEGYYFLAGDNRDNSLDSRRWGLVPQEEITGKASLIWMHWECFSCLPSLSRNGLIK
mgnify:CR=1 FL=1